MFAKYNNCVFCNSKKLKKLKNQVYKENFYVKAIKSDLNISKNKLKTIKEYKCNNCKILQNNPWFNSDISRKIYTNIYGQHNRNWENLLKFIKKGEIPNHGDLFKILKRNIRIKNYAEYNSPFMGLMLNFLLNESRSDKKSNKILFSSIFEYLTSRQVAGSSQKIKRISETKSTKLIKKINFLKKKCFINKKVNKYLFIDNSPLCWGINDNYKSVNSKAYASELLDLKIINLNENRRIKIDLFGIFHTLDHTFEPNQLLQLALETSNYVIVYCHVNPNISKQHLFSITEEFLNYLNKQKIYTLNLTKKIKKNFKSKELYFLCSKKKIMKLQE